MQVSGPVNWMVKDFHVMKVKVLRSMHVVVALNWRRRQEMLVAPVIQESWPAT
jgi:hypothetical protein